MLLNMMHKEIFPPLHDSAVDGLAGFTHRFANVNGTRIHYVIGGMGPAVVLLHGYPYTWAEWRKLMPLLIDAGYTAIAPDLRGLGDSEKTNDGYSKNNVAEDIRQLIKALGLNKINLAGNDIGTMVAIAYALNYPEEVNQLVLTESLIPGFGLEELMNPATGGYWHFGFHMQVDLAEMLTAGKEATYLTPMYQMMSTAPDAKQTAEKYYLPHYVAPGGMRAGFQHYATLIQDGQANRAAFKDKLNMPVLVLNGQRGLPQGPLLEGVLKLAKHVEADLIPNSGHSFAEDNPTWVANRLSRFFNSKSNSK